MKQQDAGRAKTVGLVSMGCLRARGRSADLLIGSVFEIEDPAVARAFERSKTLRQFLGILRARRCVADENHPSMHEPAQRSEWGLILAHQVGRADLRDPMSRVPMPRLQPPSEMRTFVQRVSSQP